MTTSDTALYLVWDNPFGTPYFSMGSAGRAPFVSLILTLDAGSRLGSSWYAAGGVLRNDHLLVALLVMAPYLYLLL